MPIGVRRAARHLSIGGVEVEAESDDWLLTCGPPTFDQFINFRAEGRNARS